MFAAQARELVMSYGWNSTSCQILNPGIDYWFPSSLQGVVGYTRRNSSLVVAGAPICAPELLAAVCAEFEAYARGQGCAVCYVCAEERLRTLFQRTPNHATVVLGAQPAWDPRTWSRIVQGNASLRAQLSRSRNKGVTVECVLPEQAEANPELRRVLCEWLRARRLPPMHFLVEPHVLDGVVDDRVVLVARRHGDAVAFLVASPIVAKNGYFVELLARSPSAPNGTGELLIDAAMQRFAREERRYVTLGLVALAHAVDKDMHGNPLWLRALMQFARAHADRFYSFRGLEQFRLKMEPERWEPIYAISNEKAFSVRTLYNLGGAFSGISPWLAIGIGIARGIRQELSRVGSRTGAVAP